MRAGAFHLTYCSNIHPGESWSEVFDNLRNYLPAVRQKLDFEGPFGVGLRLSAQAARTLEEPGRLEALREFLAAGDYYVFTINGFPYGVFHGTRVKEQVYLPDWRDAERLTYTNRLARILANLMPADLSMPGSVSTVPGAFRSEVRAWADARRIAANMLRHAVFLKRLEESSGRRVVLAVEAEPRCQIETVDEMIAFYREYLLAGDLRSQVGIETGDELDADEVGRYIGFCYDACHMAVEYERSAEALGRLRTAGVPVFKFQISSALRLDFVRGDGQASQRLAAFAEDVYLHQVVERTREDLRRYVDLPDAFAAQTRGGSAEPVQWRVHFHVPIFLSEMSGFQTTQDHLVELLDTLRKHSPTPCLEVETYTWDVLPPEYRTVDVATAIARELTWVRERLIP